MVIYFVLIVSMITLTVYPKSYSKYYDKDTSALVYESTIHSKYKGKFTISLYEEEKLSDSQVAFFSFEFNRNNVIADGSLDTYTINMPKGCIIDVDRSSISNGGVKNGNVIKYNNSPYSSEENNTNKIVMMCTINNLLDDEEYINVSVDVQETIGDKTFTYMDSNLYRISLSDYYEIYPLEPNKTVTWKWTESEKYLMFLDSADLTKISYLPKESDPLNSSYFPSSTASGYLIFKDDTGKETTLRSIYDIFYTVWLQNIVINSTDGTNAYSNAISEYVTSKYPNEESIKNKDIHLPGFKVTRYAANDGYMWKYEIVENFVGYARTAAVDFTKNNYMYFSTSDAATLDNVFLEYLNLYPYQGVDQEELIEYINSFDASGNFGISYILNNVDQNVEFNDNGDIYVNGELVEGIKYYQSDNRLELVNSNVIRIPFKDDGATMLQTLTSELPNVYGNFLSTTAINEIINSTDIQNSLTKYATLNGNQESYSDYFIVEDGNDYILVNVYSTGSEYTCVKVSILDTKIENATLSFTLSDRDKDNLLGIVNAIDEHFVDNKKLHSSLKNDNYMIVTTSGKNTNVVYSIATERVQVSYNDQTTQKEIIASYREKLLAQYQDILSTETLDFIFDENAGNEDVANNPGAFMVYPVGSTSRRAYNLFFTLSGKGAVDKDKYLLFNVYTGGYDNVYVTISELASEEENGILSFTLSDNNIVKLNGIVRSLDAYFGTTQHTIIDSNTIKVTCPTSRTISDEESMVVEDNKELNENNLESSTTMNETYVEESSLITTKEYLDVNTVSDIIEEKSTSILNQEEENKKYSNTLETETNNTTEETEETSDDVSYVPSNDASNVDAVPSSEGGTNISDSIVDEVIEVNMNLTNEISLVETG